jgi:predicted nucleic acid-binding protein
MAFVLDNSVVCGWLFESQATPYTAAIASRLRTESALAPGLLPLEYANVLRTACKQRKMVAQQAQAAARQVASLPIEIDTTIADAGELLALALRYELSSYDATYLELALRQQLPIATQDNALADAARTAGVGVITA